MRCPRLARAETANEPVWTFSSHLSELLMHGNLLITADDYGLHASVNRGIERLANRTAVDGVSVMAHADADWSTLPLLLRTGVSVGVHLVLVEERPLTRGRRMDALLEDGRLPRTHLALFSRLLARPWLRTALVEEAAAQLERARATGMRIAFVNSHQHVHLFPPLWLALRPLLDHPAWRIRAVRGLRAGTPARQQLLDVAGVACWRLAPLRRAGVIRPHGVEAAGHLDATAIASVGRRCSRIQEVCELVAHPGEESEGLRRRYGHWRYRWARELRELESREVRHILGRVAEDAE